MITILKVLFKIILGLITLFIYIPLMYLYTLGDNAIDRGDKNE